MANVKITNTEFTGIRFDGSMESGVKIVELLKNHDQIYIGDFTMDATKSDLSDFVIHVKLANLNGRSISEIGGNDIVYYMIRKDDIVLRLENAITVVSSKIAGQFGFQITGEMLTTIPDLDDFDRMADVEFITDSDIDNSAVAKRNALNDEDFNGSDRFFDAENEEQK